MSAEEISTPAPRPRHRWRRRIGRTLATLALLLALFHRVLLTGAIHLAAVKIAARQNIDLTLRVEGSVWTNLSLRDLHAVPNNRGPTPIANIAIDEITVRYSLPHLLTRGVSEFLESYTLRNASVEVKPVEGTPEQKEDLASTLHDLIQQPALFSDRVEIDDLNLIAHVPDGDFELRGMKLLLDPVRPGSLQIARLAVPKVRTWENLSAAGTYANRDMILSGLRLDPQIVIDRLELDASRRAQGINRLDVTGVLFSGTAEFALQVTELPGKHPNNVSNATAQVDSTIASFSLTKLSEYFNAPTPAIGEIPAASVHLIGDPNTPSSWTGTITTDIGAVHAGSTVLDKTTFRLDASKGWATCSATLFAAANSATVQASGKLPDSLDGFAGSALDGRFNISANDLPHLSSDLAAGSVAGNGTFTLNNNTFHTVMDVNAKGVEGKNLDAGVAELKMQATKHFPPTGQESALTDALQARIDGTASDLRAGAYALDATALSLSIDNENVRLEKLTAQRATDTLSASGEYAIPRGMNSFAAAPGKIVFALHAPSLAAFNAEPDLNGLNGKIEASGTLSNDSSGYGGAISAEASELVLRDFTAQSLQANVSIAKSVATVDNLVFALNPTDSLKLTGTVGLQKPFAYNAAVRAQVRDLSKFDTLANMKGSLAGALNLDWQGQGDLADLRSTGQIQLGVQNGKVQTVQAINAAISGTYSPEGLDFPSFRIDSNKGGFSAVIAATDNVLRVNNLAVIQAGKPLLTGSLTIPLDLRSPAKPETLVPPDGPLAADLASANIALDSFFPKGQAPAAGTANVTFTARGTIGNPNAHLLVTGRGLQAKAAAQLAPASLDADLWLIGDTLSLKAKLAQPSFSPVEIAGNLPLPLRQIVQARRIDPQSPVQLSIRVPSTSIAAVTRVVPSIRYLEGTAAVNIDVAGTIAKPDLRGSALLDLPAIRFAQPTMPSVSGFRGDLQFADNRLTIRQFGGDISGGKVALTGSVLLASLTNPQLDLRFSSTGALLLRNENVTVRADSNIRVSGPLAAANVTGDVGITQSRFFKEIEILPLELPGRPAPKPPPMPDTTPSIATPPLRDWKFDVRIKTKDPFIIQGNLANGSALVDLHATGTGKAPTMDGSVRIENFVASLPFSRLKVTNGFVYFTQEQPFVPQLNIQATSTLQDYNINVYIYGTASDPKTVMSSEPPLPQEDIVSLLATGATTASLSNGDALAGRAAILLLQGLYHKVFKTKAPPSTQNESFVSRFKTDIGGVDPRTGQQEISSRFSLTDQIQLVGELDVGGNIRGEVRYLIRFK